MKLGLDIGTKHIVLSFKDENNNIKSTYEVNGYTIVKKEDSFTENLLKKQGVPYIPYDNELIAIGSKAEKLAYMFNKTLSRPMAEGGLSKTEENSQEILAIIIKSIITSAIGKEIPQGTVLYYCTTAQPINSNKINVDFHKKIVKIMIDKFIGQGKLESHHINEARCLTIDEPGPAIGISWGAGTVTVHAGFSGVPIFEFCIVGSGDKIDIDTATRFGYDADKPNGNYAETPTTVAYAKHKIDLSKTYSDRLNQTIKIMYELLIENVVREIVKGFNDNKDKIRFPEAVPVINAGGTAMPTGFIKLLTDEFNKYKDQMSIPIGEIKLANDPLFAVSKGCLTAAELHT